VVYAAVGNGRVLAYAAGGCRFSACPPLRTLTVSGVPRQVVVAQGRLFVESRAAGDPRPSVTAFAPASA
jgi:hypothetical protein